MKTLIHPANVIEKDIVEWVCHDLYLNRDGKSFLIPIGTKGFFHEWIDDDGVEYALASVIPIGIDGLDHWIITSPNILVVEE